MPLLCSRNFNTNQTTIRIEPTIQSIRDAPFRDEESYASRPVRFNDGQA
jgi:hypothetical protein